VLNSAEREWLPGCHRMKPPGKMAGFCISHALYTSVKLRLVGFDKMKRSGDRLRASSIPHESPTEITASNRKQSQCYRIAAPVLARIIA